MIDPQLIRREPAFVIEQINKKDPAFDAKRLVQLSKDVLQLQVNLEDLRNQKNQLAKSFTKETSEDVREQSKLLSQEIKSVESQLNTLETEYRDLLLRVPNILLEDVPAGNKEENQIVKVVGQAPQFDFEPKNHVELGEINNWFDFEAATKIAGTNFALYKNDAVTLVYALTMFMLNNNIKHGYSPILPPYLVNEDSLIGASNFPRFRDEVYHLQNENLYLTPTSEVNLTAVYRDKILDAKDLPIRLTAWTSCFRREAGGYGAQERGLIRIHQFEKLELYALCKPEDANQEQDRMIACAESILNALGLHYRISLLAAQDCSFASAKTYDIEVWMPGQKVYKEVSSISNCTDFQARRSQIRFKENQNSKTQLVYTLNGSSLALPRLLVALLETYQDKDGNIELPDALKSVCIDL